MATHVAPYVEEDRCERVDGQLVMRPMSNDIHSDLQELILHLLKEQAAQDNMKARQEWSVAQPHGSDADEPDYLTPDVVVARLPYERSKIGHLVPPAFLAVEVVSPGQHGLFKKARTYASWGVEHIWIVDPQSQECFEFHGGDQFILVSDELRAGELSIQVSSLFGIKASP